MAAEGHLTKKGRVLAAMSGGVDSSVAALLLKRDGWDVVGVTMDLFGAPGESEGKCCSFDDRQDARRVCDALGIPLPAWDRSAPPPETLSHDRRVDGARLRARFSLALTYPSYREGYAHCVALDRAALDEALGAAPLPERAL